MATSGILNTTAYDSRYIEFSWTRTNIDIVSNKSTISWTLTARGSGTYSQYYAAPFELIIDGQQKYYSETRIVTTNGLQIATGTHTFSHNADGTKSFAVSLKAAIYTYAINCTGSTTFTLDTIPRAAQITSAPNFNDEQNPTITYNNFAGNSVANLYAYIYAADDKTVLIQGKALDKLGNSYTFNFTDAERQVLRQYATKNTATVHFYIRTVLGGNEYWHGAPRTLTIINNMPDASIKAWDINPDTVALTGNSSRLIKGHSSASYTITATAKKAATITEYYARNGEIVREGAGGTFHNVETGTFTISVIDSRGNETRKDTTLSLIEYVNVTCNPTITIALKGETAATITIETKGEYFNGNFGNSDNALVIEARYKENNGNYGNWFALTEANTVNYSGTTYSHKVSIDVPNYDSSYTLEVRAYDKLTTATAAPYTITLIPVFDWSKTDFNFNVPVSIKGQQIKDFLVGQGVYNGWNYRMWDSGALECWRRLQITADVNSSWGSLYTSGALYNTNLSYPYTFVELPVLTVSLMPFGAGGVIMTPGGSYGSTTETGSFEIMRGTAVSNGSFLLSYYAIGKWK